VPPQLPDGAKYLSLGQIMPTGGSGSIRDISSNYWFSSLQPVSTSGPTDLRVRQYQYQPGANIIWTPGSDTGSAGFWILREVADSWDMLRIVIETVKDRLCEGELEFRLIPQEGESQTDLKARTSEDGRIEQLKTFWKSPDGRHPFEIWLRMLVEDMLVLDAMAIYLERDTKGRLAAAVPVDGGTINRMLTDQGFTAPPPSIAYQQVLYGLPAIDLTTDDMIYTMRNERTHRRYGFGPCEQMLSIIAVGLGKQQWDTKLWQEGNIPEALCFLPPDLPIDKVTEIQGWYDSILSGNLGKRRRLTFLPGYGSARDQAFRPNIIFPKDPATMMKTPYDEWQFQAICYGMGTTPQAMLRMMNRATAKSSAETAEEEGLLPKRRTILNVINKIIQEVMGFKDIEADYGQPQDPDVEKAMTVATGYAKAGVVTINEIRVELGRDPLPFPECDEPGVLTQNGFIPLTAGVMSQSGGAAPQGAPGGTGQTPPKGTNGSGKKPPPKKPGQGALPAAAPPKQIWSGSQAGPAGAIVASKAVELLEPEGEDPLSELEREVLAKRLSIVLSPSYSTPQLMAAQVKIEHILRKVFMRQKDRAAQAASEVKKKYAAKRSY
jgi:hypothetical protein